MAPYSDPVGGQCRSSANINQRSLMPELVKYTRSQERRNLGGMTDPNVTPVRIREDVLAFPTIVTPPQPQGDQPAWLAANENPLVPSIEVQQIGAQVLAAANRYPDMATRDLITEIAKYHQVDPSYVATGNGSSALLIHALSMVARPGSEVIFAWRSFEAYPFVTQVVGSRPQMVPLDENNVHDLDAMAGAVTETTSAVMICNPNNPTGTTVTHAQIERFLTAVDPRVLVIVDEAYIDYATGEGVSSVLDLVDRFANLLVARTFSKAFGLAGLRVGYMIGQPSLIRYLRAVSTPFAVSQVAQECAIAMLHQRESVAEGVAGAIAERTRVLAELEEMGVQVPPSQTNFFWCAADRALGVDPLQAAQIFADAGIAVRAFPDGVRITLGTAAENDRVLEVMRARRAGN